MTLLSNLIKFGKISDSKKTSELIALNSGDYFGNNQVSDYGDGGMGGGEGTSGYGGGGGGRRGTIIIIINNRRRT